MKFRIFGWFLICVGMFSAITVIQGVLPFADYLAILIYIIISGVVWGVILSSSHEYHVLTRQDLTEYIMRGFDSLMVAISGGILLYSIHFIFFK